MIVEVGLVFPTCFLHPEICCGFLWLSPEVTGLIIEVGEDQTIVVYAQITKTEPEKRFLSFLSFTD